MLAHMAESQSEAAREQHKRLDGSLELLKRNLIGLLQAAQVDPADSDLPASEWNDREHLQLGLNSFNIVRATFTDPHARARTSPSPPAGLMFRMQTGDGRMLPTMPPC